MAVLIGEDTVSWTGGRTASLPHDEMSTEDGVSYIVEPNVYRPYGERIKLAANNLSSPADMITGNNEEDRPLGNMVVYYLNIERRKRAQQAVL